MLVSGEAGIGKSRLLAEVAGQAARRGLACLLGNAYEADSDVPFAPLTDLLRGVVAAVTAELTIVDRDRPPSKPTILAGKPAIAEYYHDVCGRAMTHTVEQALAGSDGIAFTEACRYPDGMRVLSANLLALRGGKIARHTLVQAWGA